MADGIRITPSPETLKAVGIDTASNRPWIVRDISRPSRHGAQVCAHCTHQNRLVNGWKAQEVTHDCKTYHFVLDEQGTIMVSTGIWEQLQKLYDNGGFERVNVVEKPPTQGLVIPTAKVSLTVADV